MATDEMAGTVVSGIQQNIDRIKLAKQKMADYLENNSSLVADGMSINEIVDEVLALIDKKGDYNVVQNLLANGNSELVITDASESSANELDSFITREISGVYINNRITKVGTSAFNNCNRIVEINLPKVTNVGNDAFSYCLKLKNINLPLCTTTGSNAFSYCAFESISLPSCQSLGGGSLRGCRQLTSINLPLVTTINGSTFYDTPIQVLDLPALTSIKAYGFGYVDSLHTLVLRNSTVCTLENANAFIDTKIAAGTGYIYVPDNLIDSYKIATNWVTFANQIKPISELEGS